MIRRKDINCLQLNYSEVGCLHRYRERSYGINGGWSSEEGKIKVGVSFVICGEDRGGKRRFFCNVNLPVMYKHLPKLLNYPGDDESYAESG